MRPLALILATSGGLGLLPAAPGTWGALLAVGVAWAWIALGAGPIGFLALGLAITAVGVWASDAAGRAWGTEDDGRIVIDEVAGQWLALLPAVAWSRGDALFPSLVTGFVLFRLFDIAKPGPVRWAERSLRGGVGVMADDVVAGVLAAAVLAAGLAAFGGWS